MNLKTILEAAKHMDWQQVVLNQGPPCFYLQSDGRFCGRAQRWHNHGCKGVHDKFVSLEDLLKKVSKPSTHKTNAHI